jgi:hypothetical protein
VPNPQRETESTPAAATSEGDSDDETRENFLDEDARCAKSGERRRTVGSAGRPLRRKPG